ncbi:hypothetical protein PGSY75_1326100 [Plasmodium gaboni]|uniref:WD repeat-containing protein n=1 Tax=Plasmodium gaboni TaxID=647221 RepID=A0A151LDN1_9APIC|nr:hypothetical protein PGSY75_1326100 [Plasmodium gaboni]KYN97058.1 hypothetical protein PGSY75_1326100 [Plasmodium gaboni]
MDDDVVIDANLMKKFEICANFKSEGYITSIDLLNNIIATTNTKNIIKIYDICERKEKLTYSIKDLVVNDIKLLKKDLKENNELCINYEIEECLFTAYENKKKMKIYHYDIINKKVLHIYELSDEIIDNSFVLHPNTHIFIVALKNKELIVYNIKNKSIIYKTNVQNNNCIVCYNKSGILYGYTGNVNTIYLCSCFGDDYNDDYFASFDISKVTVNDNYCIHMDFSHDEKKMLITTKNNSIYTVDAYTGHFLYSYNFMYEKNSPHISSYLSYPVFSFDSNFVLSGGQDGHLHIWDAQGNHVIKNNIKNNILFIKWVYNRMAFVTTSNHLLIWKPSKNV